MTIYLSTATPSLGIVHVAPNVSACLPESEILVCLARHMFDDHGDITAEELVRCGPGESLSLYGPQRKHWVYVKTAADGLSTVVFLASDFEKVIRHGSALGFAELWNDEASEHSGTVSNPVPPDIEQRLNRVLEHFIGDEFRDVEGLPEEERAGHIYYDLEAVFLWLSQMTNPSERDAA